MNWNLSNLPRRLLRRSMPSRSNKLWRQHWKGLSRSVCWKARFIQWSSYLYHSKGNLADFDISSCCHDSCQFPTSIPGDCISGWLFSPCLLINLLRQIGDLFKGKEENRSCVNLKVGCYCVWFWLRLFDQVEKELMDLPEKHKDRVKVMIFMNNPRECIWGMDGEAWYSIPYIGMTWKQTFTTRWVGERFLHLVLHLLTFILLLHPSPQIGCKVGKDLGSWNISSVQSWKVVWWFAVKIRQLRKKKVDSLNSRLHT